MYEKEIVGTAAGSHERGCLHMYKFDSVTWGCDGETKKSGIVIQNCSFNITFLRTLQSSDISADTAHITFT
jgi:hypothetical protein